MIYPNQTGTSWFYQLPPMVDLDGDAVTMSVKWGTAEAFMILDQTKNILRINDIREDKTNPLKPGYYPIFLTLSD